LDVKTDGREPAVRTSYSSPGPPEIDELTKKEEIKDKKSPSVRGGIILFPGQGTPMQLWELPERENSWTCSEFLFQTYPFGLQG